MKAVGKYQPGKAPTLKCSLNSIAKRRHFTVLNKQWSNWKEALPWIIWDHLWQTPLWEWTCGLSYFKAKEGSRSTENNIPSDSFSSVTVLLYQLFTMGWEKINKSLDTIQNEAMQTILDCTRCTATDAMMHILDIPSIAEMCSLGQVILHFKFTQNTDLYDTLHNMRRKQARLARTTIWVSRAKNYIILCCKLKDVRLGSGVARGTEWQ